MGRRTSGAQVGLEKIGLVQADAATLTTTQTNIDLTLDPNGTGGVLVNGDLTITDQQDLRLRESSGNGTNYIAQQAASNMASNYTITWPAAVSAVAGNVLTSDTAGNLSWTSPSSLTISVTDPGASATVHYPVFATNAGAVPTSLTPNARSNLSFVPSTGMLTTGAVTAAGVDGSTSASGQLTIRGTSSGTKNTASILMNENIASSNTTTGTLVVTGGVGIGGALNVGGSIVSNGSTVHTFASAPFLGTNSLIRTNANTINENITIPAGTCGVSAGPITIASGQTVTVNGDWSIV